MNAKKRIALITATLGLACAGHAENGVELIQGVLAQTNHTLIPMLDVRTRYEYGEQDSLDASHAATVRARVGLQSQDYNGFTGLVEFEGTRALDSTSYRPGAYAPPGKTIIADPKNTELNRAQVQFKRGVNTAIAGRQRIILDNARFVGNVGWRQNEQTYDAFSYKNTGIEDVALFYAYLDQVNRIFGSEAPVNARRYDSDSHLFNASYTGLSNQTITAYAYFLDFDNAPAVSANTYGISYAVKGVIADDYKATGYAEVAVQEDGAENPVQYTAPYLHLNGSVAREGYIGLLGLEILGSDGDIIGFSTPLATAHKFNGWNDQFLATPAAGLQDYYAGLTVPFVPKVPMTFIFHYFTSADGGQTYGHEFDALAVKKLSDKTKAIAKASFYNADQFSEDRTRFSVEVNYKY